MTSLIKCIIIGLFLTFSVSFVSCVDKRYNVHKLEGPSKIERASSSLLDINCYIGKPKTPLAVFKTVELSLELATERFSQYEGPTPEAVWEAYLEDRSLFSLRLLSRRLPRQLRLSPFNTTCVAIRTDERYVLELSVIEVDQWKVCLVVLGAVLFLFSRSLGSSAPLFYVCGVSLGVFASFMVLVYVLCRLLPGRPVMYGAMLGGWTLGIYALQLLWSNFRPLLLAYHSYVLIYVAVTAFVSFLVCYKLGPPKDARNKNLISWTLQAVGCVLVYFSTEMTEAFVAICLALVLAKVFPRSWLWALGGRRWWWRRAPVRVLLSAEQFEEQGRAETARALEELRGYCSSPDCPQWKLMLRLKDPQRFANFMETRNHVTKEEMEEYDSSDLIIRRKNISNGGPKGERQRSVSRPYEVSSSEDSSLSSDEL